ncbi:MAG: PilZ domain-containing protein [Kangiellaceae bacterium]|nr:PilZ domain-containing protein [Kangiellaceae bacterium]
MNDNERRHHQRVSFDSPAKLISGEQRFSCQIIDLSIHGVLLRPYGVVRAESGASFELEIPLNESGDTDSQIITMSLSLAHSTPESLGFVCNTIDLESITHLRRIIELNSGHPELLEREFAQLVAP